MESIVLMQKGRADLAIGGERNKETPTSLAKFDEGLEKTECCHQMFSGRDGKRTLFRDACQGEELPEAQGCFAKRLRSIIYQASLGQMAGALCARAVTLLLEQTMAPNRSPEAGPEGALGRDGHHHSMELSTPLLLSCFLPLCRQWGIAAWHSTQQERVSNPATACRVQRGGKELATHVGQGGVNLGVTWELAVANNLGPDARV